MMLQFDGFTEELFGPGVTTKPPPILRLADWLERDLPAPDFLLGSWLTTTTRGLLVAPTGIGKTMLGLAICAAVASGRDFLHWGGRRPARALFIDGEMSRRLLKQRLIDEVRRLGLKPEGLHILSHDDLENFAPLNTPDGQKAIEGIIDEIGGVDLIAFDNIMSLVAGDQKDEEGWRVMMPWLHSLTRRDIGQIWVHHTGHDETRSYGTKTREWQMDTVMHCETVDREDTDLSFQISFRKARERTPETRREFSDARIALVADTWMYEVTGSRKSGVHPVTRKFFDALQAAALKADASMVLGYPAATIIAWQGECEGQGLIERTAKPNSARSLFSQNKLRLIAANWIACNESMAWILR